MRLSHERDPSTLGRTQGGCCGPAVDATLDELLRDDLIRTVMQADGIDPAAIRTLVGTVRRQRMAW